MVFKYDVQNIIFKNKDDIGKTFFIIGVLLLFYLIFSPLTNVFFHPDEFFTFGMITFPFSDILTATAVDTHPPGHYYILKMVLTVLDTFHIGHNSIFVTKMVSIVPYALILLVSYTKLKKEYGWFTVGIFVFAMGLMSGFFIQFLTIRMYNWGLFFLLMSFIYFKDIINDSNMKAWILFSLFSALVLYTQYFIGFSLALIYLLLFIYLFCFHQDNFKEEFKKFMGSILLTILFYSPWIPYFITQMSKKRGSHNLPPLDWNSIVNTCIYYVTGSDFLIIKIFAIIFTIFIIILAFKKYNFEPTPENYYVICGFVVFFGTIFISIILSVIREPIIVSRYFIPVSSIIWLSISILIGKMDNNHFFIISFVFLLLFGFSGVVDINSQSSHLYAVGTHWQDMFNEINSDPNALVIYDGEVGVLEYDTFLDNIESYSPPVPTIYGVNNFTTHKLWDFEEKSPSELENILNHNNDKNLYYIHAWGNLGYNSTNLKEIGQMAGARFYHVER